MKLKGRVITIIPRIKISIKFFFVMLSLIPKCKADRNKNNRKTKLGKFIHIIKKINGMVIYAIKKNIVSNLFFIILLCLAIEISKLPWAKPGQRSGKEKSKI